MAIEEPLSAEVTRRAGVIALRDVVSGERPGGLALTGRARQTGEPALRLQFLQPAEFASRIPGGCVDTQRKLIRLIAASRIIPTVEIGRPLVAEHAIQLVIGFPGSPSILARILKNQIRQFVIDAAEIFREDHDGSRIGPTNRSIVSSVAQ